MCGKTMGTTAARMPIVVGVARSGTTLLRMIVDAHPQVAIPPETGFLPALAELDRPRRFSASNRRRRGNQRHRNTHRQRRLGKACFQLVSQGFGFRVRAAERQRPGRPLERKIVPRQLEAGGNLLSRLGTLPDDRVSVAIFN